MTGEAYLDFFARLYGLSLPAATIAAKLSEVGLAPSRGQSFTRTRRAAP